MDIIQEQFDALKKWDRYSEAKLTRLSNGTAVVAIPNFQLAPGWNKRSTTVYFVVPVGYPTAKPDTFWADSDLHLASGAEPQASNRSNDSHGLPDKRNLLWFSWHAQTWNPNRDSLSTYAAVIDRRLREPR
jgi:Prokaryotic E2 family E